MKFEDYLNEVKNYPNTAQEGIDKFLKKDPKADKIPYEIIGEGDDEKGMRIVAKWMANKEKSVSDAVKYFGTVEEWFELSDKETDRAVKKLLKNLPPAVKPKGK